MKSRSLNMLIVLALFFSLLGSALTVTPARAAGIVVNSNADTVANDGECTLREAITNANGDNQSGSTDCAAGSGADTITFAADYTITLAGTQLPVITSQIAINGATNTIIQASPCDPVNLPGGCTPTLNRVFQVSSTGNLALDMLTVRYGYCDGTCPSDHIVGGIGGGILNDGVLTVTNSTISNNKTNFSAGGIYSLGMSTLTVLNSTIANNSTGSQGGGMWVAKGSVTNSTIVGNTGSLGAGIFKQPAFPGGDQLLAITNSTISGNNIHNNGSGVSITNSIVNNSSCTSSAVIDGGNNLDSGNTCNFTVNALINTNPLLGSLGDNGGPTQTMALLSGSPATDKGANCAATDQRGVPRNVICDIGAYESVFGDVPTTHPYWLDIETLYANGFTAGCSISPSLFCPEQTMNRSQSAVFILRGNFGSAYLPPTSPFNPAFGDDWSSGPWAQKWAQGMLAEGLTAGCSTSSLLYCPWDQMPRLQAAVFGMRLLNGNTYVPPAATGTVLADITDPNAWYAKWVEQAYLSGILPACGSSGGKPLFCPNDLVSRGLGAYMIVRAKNLTMP